MYLQFQYVVKQVHLNIIFNLLGFVLCKLYSEDYWLKNQKCFGWICLCPLSLQYHPKGTAHFNIVRVTTHWQWGTSSPGDITSPCKDWRAQKIALKIILKLCYCHVWSIAQKKYGNTLHLMFKDFSDLYLRKIPFDLYEIFCCLIEHQLFQTKTFFPIEIREECKGEIHQG